MRHNAAWLLPLYSRIPMESVRARLRRWIVRWEGGPGFSITIRQLWKRFQGVEIGWYSYWPWREKPGVLHRGTSLGKYVWMADSVRTFTRNHPFHLRSTHGFFYNPALGKVAGPPLAFGILEIGHGAWIGPNAIIVPPTRRIGIGAVVRPGSVVCMDIPDYAVVAGFPARVVGWRFSKAEIAGLLESRWWEAAPQVLEHGPLDRARGTDGLKASV